VLRRDDGLALRRGKRGGDADEFAHPKGEKIVMPTTPERGVWWSTKEFYGGTGDHKLYRKSGENSYWGLRLGRLKLKVCVAKKGHENKPKDSECRIRKEKERGRSEFPLGIEPGSLEVKTVNESRGNCNGQATRARIGGKVE